jgi:flagellar biosynthesis/type III secretory pathway protein FliH
VIRQAEAERIARDAVVLDLGDLARQAEGVRARARAEAESLLAKAAAERQRLIGNAREEGLARGLEEGRVRGEAEGKKAGHDAALAERREALQKLEAAWATALEEFVSQRESMLLSARQDVLALAVMMGERITKRVVQVDPAVVQGQLESVLAILAKPTRLTIAISPADEALTREAVPSLMARFPGAQHIDLIVDETLGTGSCVARTGGGGTIDATIPTQLDRMVEALLPGVGKSTLDGLASGAPGLTAAGEQVPGAPGSDRPGPPSQGSAA